MMKNSNLVVDFLDDEKEMVRADINVLVLMSFHEDFDNVYWFGIRGGIKDAGMYCNRIDDFYFVGNVLVEINEQIQDADVIVAEITGSNPNVLYEVGIAHTLKKLTILLVQNVDDIPFDLSMHNHLVYNPRNIKGLRERLAELLKAVTKKIWN